MYAIIDFISATEYSESLMFSCCIPIFIFRERFHFTFKVEAVCYAKEACLYDG